MDCGRKVLMVESTKYSKKHVMENWSGFKQEFIMAIFGPLNVTKKDDKGLWFIDEVCMKWSGRTHWLTLQYVVCWRDTKKQIHRNTIPTK